MLSKKILIIITKAEIGGAQVFVLNLAKKLKENFGAEVHVGFGDGEFLPNELKKLKIPYTRFNSLKRTKNPLDGLRFVFELKKFLSNNKFDIVHFNSSNALFGAIPAKMAKAKTIFTFHGLSVLSNGYKKDKILKFAYSIFFKFFIRFINKSVFVSKCDLAFAKKIKLVQENAIVIYNGLEIEFVPREKAIKNLEKKIDVSLKDKFIVGSVSRLDYAKNFEFLIKNFKRILKIKPNAVAIIIGEGSERKKYEKLIKKLDLQDKIFLPGRDPAKKYFKAFDLCVLTSRYEGMPITIIEALHAKIPVLASNVGGVREILHMNKFQIFELNDNKMFINKFKEIVQNNNHSNIALENFKQADNFSAQKMAEKYWQIYG